MKPFGFFREIPSKKFASLGASFFRRSEFSLSCFRESAHLFSSLQYADPAPTASTQYTAGIKFGAQQSISMNYGGHPVIELTRITQDGAATRERRNMASPRRRPAAFRDSFGHMLRSLHGAVCVGRGLLTVLCCSLATAQPPTQVPCRAKRNMSKDGRHDFDFEVGNWNAHVSMLIHRLSHSADWNEF